LKTTYYGYFGLATFICLSPVLVAASVLIQAQPRIPKPAEFTLAEARAAIVATYARWGKARIKIDKKAMDSIVAPEFYVSMYGRKLSREEFLSDIGIEQPGFRLTRFDVDVLTVRKTERGWTAVIAEKVEVATPGSEGNPQKRCSYWVTRDGFSIEGDELLITFSEAIGHENWAPGETPPIGGW
jgi:hypothetical protein